MAQKYKKYFVIFKDNPDNPVRHPLKRWCRENRDIINFEPQGGSQDYARNLRKEGWKRRNTAESVFMIKPDESGDISYAESIIEEFEETEQETDSEYEEAQEITFGLERDLQTSLRKNIHQLETGLRIIDDGIERDTEAGRIDITATDEKNNIVVIELKAGTASPRAISQVLAYMGAISKEEQKPVRGILVADDFEKNALFAAFAVPNLQLRKYSFKFSFEDVKLTS